MQSNSQLAQSQRVDGGLIVRKTTLIKMNTKPIDDIYKRDSKVRDFEALKKVILFMSLNFSFLRFFMHGFD